MIRKNDFGYFTDVKWAFFNGSPILYQDLNQIRKETLENPRLKEQIAKETQSIIEKKATTKMSEQ